MLSGIIRVAEKCRGAQTDGETRVMKGLKLQSRRWTTKSAAEGEGGGGGGGGLYRRYGTIGRWRTGPRGSQGRGLVRRVGPRAFPRFRSISHQPSVALLYRGPPPSRYNVYIPSSLALAAWWPLTPHYPVPGLNWRRRLLRIHINTMHAGTVCTRIGSMDV